jgi:acetyl esterase/lipase
MKIKSLFPVTILFVLLFTSCSKSDSGGGGTPAPMPVAEKTMPDVSYGTDAKQKMDIYLPANRTTTSTKVLIYIHGGAWTVGDKADLTAAGVDTLKKRFPDYAIFNINYRLAVAGFPATNVFPTQEQDVKAAVEFIYSNRATYLVSDKFVLAGVSAGGHLALLQAYKYQSPVKIKAVVDLCGPTDMSAMYTDYASNPTNQLGIVVLMSGTPATNLNLYQQSSPVFFVSAANSCPTIIFQGSADPIVNATTQSFALKTKLSTAAVINEYDVYPGLLHVDTWPPATFTDAYNKIQVFLAANVQ